MTRGTTGSASLGSALAQYYDRLLLDNIYPDLFAYQFGEKRRLPRNMGKVANYTRISKAGTGFPLPFQMTEGTPIGLSGLSATTKNVTISGYAAAVGLSDLVIMTAISDTVRNAVFELSKGAALKVERTIRGKILSGNGAKLWASGLTSATLHTTTTIRAIDLAKGKGKLRQNNARPWPDGTFAAIMHPSPVYNLQSDTATGGWIDVNKYASTQTVDLIYRGEVGKAYGVRCVESAEAKQVTSAIGALFSGASSGFITEIIAPGAYAVVELDGAAASVFVKQVGSSGSADPANQIGSVAAKLYFAPIDFDMSNRAVRLISGGRTL